MLFSLGCKLCGIQPGQQINVNAVFDHLKQRAVQKAKLIDAVHCRVQIVLQRFIDFIKQIRQRAEQGILPFEIMIEGAFGRPGFQDDLIDGCVVIALLIEQLPRRGNNFALSGLRRFFRHCDLSVSFTIRPAGCAFYYIIARRSAHLQAYVIEKSVAARTQQSAPPAHI